MIRPEAKQHYHRKHYHDHVIFGGGTFFRSKLVQPGDPDFQGSICNTIQLDISSDAASPTETFTLTISFEGTIVETYQVTQPSNCSIMGGGQIGTLRSNIAGSQYISMPTRGTDAQDIAGMDSDCLTTFSGLMSGGTGPGENDVASIRTGPDRTIVYVNSKENSNGAPTASSDLIQWNYDTLSWVPFVTDGDCRPEGTDC